MREIRIEQQCVMDDLEEIALSRNCNLILDIDMKVEQDCQNIYPTGWADFDEILNGGFQPGLYTIGAMAGLGKTSFCLQMADHIAEQLSQKSSPNTVLFFSLEMSGLELMAKSLSRLSYYLNGKKNKAMTTHFILDQRNWGKLTSAEIKVWNDITKKYSEYASRLAIIEGVGDLGVNQIKEKIELFKKADGKAPIVFIDYLQIIAPFTSHYSDKQNTDKAVLELKRLSRDYNIPIVVVSSFSRDSYFKPVGLSSYKESGAIEYSSDVLIGLQYEGMDYQSETRDTRARRVMGIMDTVTKKSSNGDCVGIQAKILKNRNGARGEALFDFYPKFNYFKEQD